MASRDRLRSPVFTSGLSVPHFALTGRAGVRPVCQVMGSSVYQVGWQGYPWGSGMGQGLAVELTQLTNAWNTARRLALGRLEEEAAAAGCHAVVDVTFESRRHEFLAGEIEIVVNGTAVHVDGAAAGGPPVLTDLSMSDYVLLRRGGYDPVGVVASTSVFYVVAGWRTWRATSNIFQPNQELTDFTQGVYEAREMALARASTQAERLGAAGMVGVSVDHRVEVREQQGGGRTKDLIVTFHVLGTAIAPHGEHRALAPDTVVRQGGPTR